MLENSNILDILGFYREADVIDKTIIANNFSLTKKKKNPYSDINMQLLTMKQKVNDIESLFNETLNSLEEPPKDKSIHPSNNSVMNINYLSNAPVDIENNGSDNDTTIKVT